MTAEEKTSLAVFLDTAGDVLRDGYWKDRPPPSFVSDTEREGMDFSSGATVPPLIHDNLGKIADEIRSCTACFLHEARILAVPGEGVEHPLVLVIGEAPGSEEDEKGRPFVGPAGKLLDRMLASVGLSRTENCFVANTVKCRPSGNRDPLPEETAACAPFLTRQIYVLQPKFILCVGRVAAQTMLRTADGIGRLRGRFFDFFNSFDSDGMDAIAPRSATSRAIPLIATYHPSALLRDPSLKRPAWEDLKKLRERLNPYMGDAPPPTANPS